MVYGDHDEDSSRSDLLKLNMYDSHGVEDYLPVASARRFNEAKQLYIGRQRQ